MDKDYLLLKRAAPSRPSGEWSDDDYDVLADGVVVGRIMRALAAPVGTDVDARHRISQRPHGDARLRGDPRGRHGSIRQELAAGVTKNVATDMNLI